MDNKEGLLQRFKQIILDEPKSASLLSKEIGIARESLKGFMRGTKIPNLVTMTKIERYIISKE